MEAVGEIARETPDQLTMQVIAARAEIGTATAYRYFSTVDDVLAAYVLGVIDDLAAFSADSPLEGRKLFAAVLDKWIALLEHHGTTIVQLRSRRGFLARLHTGDQNILGVQRAWERPVTGLLADLDITSITLDHALFLLNILFDPREINDLRTEEKLPPRKVAARLTEAYIGALRGWSTVD